MALTDTAIRNTKPAEKPLKLTDERGLYLLLKSNGSRWYWFDSAMTANAKPSPWGSIPT